MRMIGHVSNEASAANFGDFLYLRGIDNRIELERDGTWSIWVLEEEELEKSKQLLNEFSANPNAAQYRGLEEKARSQREREKRKADEAQRRYFDRETLVRRRHAPGFVTMGLIGASVVVFLLSDMGQNREFLEGWFTNLPEILSGEVWRLFSPIFVHFGIPHILFNMLWTSHLGSMIEARRGSLYLLTLVLVIAAASNVGQFLVGGKYFGGMSGVVYGLIGYVWMKGKFDPGSGLWLSPQDITLALIWFGLCFLGILPIANGAHTVGLVLGVVWGYLSARGIAGLRL